MPVSVPRTIARSAAACTLFVLSACTERMPTDLIADDVAPVSHTISIGVECVASVSAGTVTCGQAPEAGFAAAGVVYGGQGVRVNLASSNVSYDGIGQFQFDVTVQNLMNEAIGLRGTATLPGHQLRNFPDPDGIRVFFHSRPTAVTGTGTITVANADGVDVFTAADQPFYAYHNILAKDEVSPAKTWIFNVPPTVEEFEFSMYIETDVEYLLVINELLANPGGIISDASGEWLEITNVGTLPVNMQGMVIADSAASGRRPYHLISVPLVVEPGLSVVLGNNTNTTQNGGVNVDYSYVNALAFANSLDAVKIARVFGDDTITVDRTQYASAAISAQNGISRELKNPLLDNANMDGSNWADPLVTAVYGPGGRGTPGAQNSTFEPMAAGNRATAAAATVSPARPTRRP